MPASDRDRDRRIVAALFFGLLCLYALSASRSVGLEDDGEFILAGYFWGVAHPPGYPLHTLLAFLFSHLPIATVAWRVHVLSGVFGAMAGAVLFLGAREAGVRLHLAAAAALCFGVSDVWWSQSIVAEVYSLHVFLFATAWLLALRIHRGDTRGGMFVSLASVTGLALANHWPLTILGGPALLLLVWRHWRQLLRPSVLLAGLACASVPYALLVLRSQQDPEISFYGPLRSLGDFWFMLSRHGYGAIDHAVMSTAADRVQFAGFAAAEWARQFTVVGAALALLGLATLLNRRRGELALSLAWIAFGIVALLVMLLGFEYHNQTRAAFRVYPLTAYFGTAVLLACGLESLAGWLESRGMLRWAAAAIGAAVMFGLLAVNAPANWKASDDWGRAYARAVLAETPADAVIVTASDWTTNTLGYEHFIEGACPSCTLVEADGLLFRDRPFEPLQIPAPERSKLLVQYLQRLKWPVAYADSAPPGLTVNDRWLVRIVSTDAATHSPVQISHAAHEFYRERVDRDDPADATVSTVQQELRRRYFQLLAAGGGIPDEDLGALCREFYACLGLLEGAYARPARYRAALLEPLAARGVSLMPHYVHRWDRARIHELHGLLLARMPLREQAILELEQAVTIAPDQSADAQRALGELGAERPAIFRSP